jgi:EAL and modified HD-GYP domain-containing signal transduction protein
LLGACRKLRNSGFRLALVDFAWSPVPHPLLDLVEFVKVDLRRVHRRERLRQWLEGTSVTMVADGVHSQDDYRQARAEGFKQFQGPYFCKPEMIKDRRIPANQMFHIEILRQLFRDPLDLRALCPLVMRDASLVYRVLRLVNSPICAIREPVSSIETAIMILGDVTFRRIATLAIQCALNEGRPPEILHMALVRARFCSQGAKLCNLDPSEQYLLGMLSLLPAMLRLPMETLVRELPLSPEIRQALLGGPVYERCLLAWIESHEWNNAAETQEIALRFGMDSRALTQLYVEALAWDATAPNPFH